MIKNKKKIFALSVVALILVFLMAVGLSFSWIDDVKLVEFNNDDLANNSAPLKTGTDINSTVNITKDNNTVDLGNMLENSDITYTDNDHAHIKYDTSSPNNIKNPDMDDINENKGYFYESGDMHLSPCYSDGETFFFPRVGSNGYREGNKDDENVSYISFTVKVSSPNANVDFWFEEIPSVKIHETNNSISNARYAITVDGESHIYSSTGLANTISGSTITPVSGVRKTSVYTYDEEDNTTLARGKNSNTLFSIKKGSTVNLNIKIWLESGFNADITASDINLKLVSSWAYKRNITIIDQTSSCKYIGTNSNANSSWLGNEKLYITLPDVLNEMCKECYGDSDPSYSPTYRDWDDVKVEPGYEDAPFSDLRTNNTNIVETGTTSDGFTYYTVKNIPLVYKNETMMLFRDNDAWNTGNYTTSADNYSVKCYNWWRTALPDTFTNDNYRLYGGSHDNEAYRYFKENVDNKYKTFQGYGTWGDLIKIQVDARTKAISTTDDNNKVENISTNLAYKQSDGDSRDLYICDYSDKNASGEVYIHGMSYEQSEECWFAYVPSSSTLIQFYYHYSDSEQGWWAYNSWSGDNPQQRPSNSYKYFFTHRMKHSSNYDGIGYWENQDKVYLLKNGNIGTADKVDAYMYYNVGNNDYNTNNSAPGVQMTNTGLTDPRDNSTPVFEISTVANNNPGYYLYVKFSGIWDNNSSNPVYGRQLPMCPGCYFDWQNNRWIGSLNGASREPSSDSGSGDSGGGSSSGTGSMDGYETDSPFVFKVQRNNQEYTHYAKTNVSGGTTFKVRITLAAGTNVTTVQGNSINYGLERASQVYDVGSDFHGLNLTTSYSNNFSLRATVAGDYIVTFAYGNSQNDLSLSSIELEAS